MKSTSTKTIFDFVDYKGDICDGFPCFRRNFVIEQQKLLNGSSRSFPFTLHSASDHSYRDRGERCLLAKPDFIPEGSRWCKRCDTVKPLLKFPVNLKESKGRNYWCASCGEKRRRFCRIVKRDLDSSIQYADYRKAERKQELRTAVEIYEARVASQKYTHAQS